MWSRGAVLVALILASAVLAKGCSPHGVHLNKLVEGIGKNIKQQILLENGTIKRNQNASVERKVAVSKSCADDQKTKAGDQVSVNFKEFLRDGTIVQNTDDRPFTFILGKREAPQGWDRGLRKLCVGDRVYLIVSEDQDGEEDYSDEVKDEAGDTHFYEITVEVIVRKMKDAPVRNGKGILLQRSGKCRDAKLVKDGDKVTMSSTARIPNIIYLHYPHPTGNIPITVKQRGVPGVRVDKSLDTVQTGSGQIIPGWEVGIRGACEGEVRKIMISPDMAFGEKGIHQHIPPNSPLVLEVKILDVERDSVVTFLKQGANGELFNFSQK